MQFAIDTHNLTFVVCQAPKPVTKFGSDELRTRDGQPLHSVELFVLSDDGGDKIRVKVPGSPDLQPRSEVKVVGLVAFPWEQNGKSGVSFSADRIEPTAKLSKAS